MSGSCQATYGAAQAGPAPETSVEIAEARPPAHREPSVSAHPWAEELEQASAEQVLEWALDRWAGEIALCTSFQAEGMVLLDMALRPGGSVRAKPRPRVLTLDTGRLPQETYDHIDRVRRRYDVEIEMIHPRGRDLDDLVRRGGPNSFLESVEARLECCRVRKVEPMRRALRPFSAWIAGLRRDQTSSRQGISKVELDFVNGPGGDLVKVSPLADWSLEEVWSYLREHRVPHHPLYDRGYLSIGCAPCTRPSRPAEEARAGRWWWEEEGNRECGLHVLNGGRG